MIYDGSALSELIKETEKCVNCGFCETVCPTFPAAGFNSIYGARGRVDLGKYISRQYEREGRIGLRITDSFYSCLDCNACLEVCPAGVNAGKVSDLAKRLIADGRAVDPRNEQPIAKMIVELTKKFRNPLGIREKCADWAERIEFDENSDTLLYTGNMYQLMPYSKWLRIIRAVLGKTLSLKISAFISENPSIIKIIPMFYDRKLKEIMNNTLGNIVELLKDEGISFSYLGKDEPYPGTFLYDLGYEKEFAEYAHDIYYFFKSRGIKKLITIDPHTYDLLKFQYPKFVKGFDIHILYYLSLLNSKKFKKSETTTAFHEPCHLVRGGDDYNVPREILDYMSNLKMPAKNGKDAYCCGGPDELLFGDLSTKISEERFTQLKNVNTEEIVTACPVCFVNLRKSSNVVEISDFIFRLGKI